MYDEKRDPAQAAGHASVLRTARGFPPSRFPSTLIEKKLTPIDIEAVSA